MGKVYGNTFEDLKPAVMGDETLTEIGRLIRACATIEHIAELWLCRLAGINEPMLRILLGRTNISAKLGIAANLASLKGSEAVKLHKWAFGDQYSDIIHCRNCVAHAALIGQMSDGSFCFETPDILGHEEAGEQRRAVGTFRHEDIAFYAKAAEHGIHEIEKALGVQASREKHPPQRLEPHPKAQGRPPAKQKPHRPASGE